MLEFKKFIGYSKYDGEKKFEITYKCPDYRGFFNYHDIIYPGSDDE